MGLLNNIADKADDAITALMKQARKYKTPDEFVEAQKRYYHGTVGGHKLTKTTKGDLGEGLYLTDPHEAHYFASQKRQAFGGKPAILEYEATPQKTLTLGVGGDGEIAYDFYKKGLTGALGKFARDNGYDAIYRPLGVGGAGIELMVLSPKNIKFKNRFSSIDDVISSQIEQKSQLTDIWNKANAKKVLPAVILAGSLMTPNSYAEQWKNYKNTEPALQEPLIDPTTLLAGPARWGGGLMNMGIDTALKYIMGNRQ